jgi:hypothetical protein
MPLTEKQEAFADTKLRTIMSNTGIKGITYEAFPSGSFIVRDLDGSYVDSLGDITEAVECLLCCVHNFRSVQPDVVDDLIDYLGAQKFLH